MAVNESVILVGNAYWPSIGGVENSLRHLALEARALGHQVCIVVSDIGLAADHVNVAHEVVDGFDVYRYRLQPLQSALFKAVNIFASYRQLCALLKRLKARQPNAKVIARYHLGALAAVSCGFERVVYLVPSLMNNQIKVEMAQRVSLFRRLRSRLFIHYHARSQKKALEKSQLAVFSTSMQRQCEQLLGPTHKRFCITKPGIDNSRFYPVDPAQRLPLRAHLGLPTDKTVVLFVGRFVRAKGVDVLIEALKVLPDHHLALVGEGGEGDNYQRQIEQYGLQNQVSFHQPTRTVEDFYRCADVFVMSSRYEPLGQTILEAFASGLPLVAFKKGAGVDTATQELGMDAHVFYAAEFSAAALATALQACHEGRQNRQRETIAAAAQARFSWKTLYQTLINQ